MVVGIILTRIFSAVEYRHDRTVAGMPLTAIGTVGEHGFEFLHLPLGRIDDHRERMIAARRDRPLSIATRITLEQLHGLLRYCRFDQPFLAKPSFP